MNSPPVYICSTCWTGWTVAHMEACPNKYCTPWCSKHGGWEPRVDLTKYGDSCPRCQSEALPPQPYKYSTATATPGMAINIYPQTLPVTWYPNDNVVNVMPGYVFQTTGVGTYKIGVTSPITTDKPISADKLMAAMKIQEAAKPKEPVPKPKTPGRFDFLAEEIEEEKKPAV